ncbi:cytochrome b/b6 domain-containing protein [Luteimonas sp. YGD11-2]|uniref:cytochrome b n=1 Tax=Luteimonas sp. YGD11-2 TaxID=2508168 RepID=UPI00100B60FD|nr:cytochrome b/b6 domain-containing protein [Luteimonas sp. YGD11-2]
MTRYPLSARLMHWAMAALLLSQLSLGVTMVDRWQPWTTPAIQLHKAFGVLALVLVLVRLANRLRFHAPPLPRSIPVLQRALARASHWALYALMLALPLTGWAMHGAAGLPVRVGGFVLPTVMDADLARYGLLRELHAWLAYGLLALVLVHAGAALHHAWVRRDGVFDHMAFGRRRPAEAAAPPITDVATSEGTVAP